MIVDGIVRITLSLNVYDLKTDAVEVDRYGEAKITDPDQFFLDWCDAWEHGTGELLGASTDCYNTKLEACEEEDDEEDTEE